MSISAVQSTNTSEARLRAMIEATPECIKIVAPDGTLQFMNKAGLDMIEASTLDAVLGRSMVEVISPDFRGTWIERHNRICTGESLNWELQIIGLRGTRRWIETRAVPFANGNGTFCQLAVMRDITARKPAEEGLKRNEIILKGQKLALEQAVNGRPISDVLETLVTTVEEQSNKRLIASILMLDKDGKHLRHGAAPHLPQSYNQAIDGIEIGPSAGSCGTAAFTKKEVIVEDISTDPLWINFKDLALAHGLKACWSTPIVSSGNKLLATFALYYPEVHRPSSQEREAVELLARTAGIVIEWYNEIAERKNFQDALATSESHLRALVTATSDVIYKVSGDWSEMATLDGKSFLKDVHEPVKNWRDINVHPDHRKMVDEAIDIAIKSKSIFQMEHKVNRADGSAGWTFSRAIPILDSNRNILEWYGVASDITERKNFETALAESEAKFRRFYESDMLPIAFWDLHGQVYECNRAFANLVGYSIEEILAGDFNWMEATVPECRHIHQEKISVALAGKTFIDPYEVELIRKDGNRIYVLAGYTLLEGSKENGVAFVMDMTLQKSIRTSLETRVAERTSELTKVNMALQQSNEDLLQFAHVASHDLREPIRKIKTFGYRLKEECNGALNDKSQSFLDKILSSASRMSSMIDGVLAYSTVNASQQSSEPIDLNYIVEEIKSDFEIVINQKNGIIEAGQLPVIYGNRFLIYQLFYNLLNNALKFSKADVPPHITIYAEPADAFSDSNVKVAICDNGIGFDPVHAEKIFDSFTRLNPKDKYEGTGLGLALCKKIVQRHQGSITAESERDKGAKFYLTLPLIKTINDTKKL